MVLVCWDAGFEAEKKGRAEVTDSCQDQPKSPPKDKATANMNKHQQELKGKQETIVLGGGYEGRRSEVGESWVNRSAHQLASFGNA